MWFETLPKKCPPSDAEAIKGTFYRLVEGAIASCDDFWSHRKLWPNKEFRVSECRARSLSIFDCYEACEKVRKLPLHKNKRIAEISLDSGSGLAKQTGQDKSHYSWWRSSSFRPQEQSSVIAK